MAIDSKSELARLAAIAADSWYARGVNSAAITHSMKVYARHWRPGHVLELGPAEGVMTGPLSQHFEHMTLVDGSEEFCNSLRERFPSATVVHSLFEDFTTDDRFDTIVLGHVLEHVDDSVGVLSMARRYLAPGGVICASVPNSQSLHRQAAVLMGLLPYESALNETDVHHGHRRVYNPESFMRDVRAADLKVRVFGGFWMKPLSNAQLDATWTQPMIDAFMQLGERYPDIAAEIYVVAEP